ncbi:MAG: HAMP domain-containing histidine kinase [Actinobacteria bacterium]|nr:HAMP domain-containing histidine kinase [Actinomycetota bacterium]
MMFKSARFRIAVWFVIAILFISLLFSFVFYRAVARDLNSRYADIEIKIKNNIRGLEKVPPVLKTMLRNDLRFAKQRVIFILLLANGGIFLMSIFIGYFLAGRALYPIEEMVSEQDRFISDASHELRTPLTVIKTATEVALRDSSMSAKEARKILKDNLNDLAELEMLTERLLHLSRYNKGKKALKFEKLDLGAVAAKIFKKVKPLADTKNLEFNLKTETAFINADKISIEEMMLILIDNAIKYTAEKGIIFLEVLKEGRHATFKVTDTGPGISSHDLPYIFDRFYRADSSRARQGAKGFGLGLSVADKIAKLHGGNIKVDSSPKKGSVFKVILPLAR